MNENENISPHFFEGVEKLLEVWFETPDTNKNADLRKIPRWVASLLLARSVLFPEPKSQNHLLQLRLEIIDFCVLNLKIVPSEINFWNATSCLFWKFIYIFHSICFPRNRKIASPPHLHMFSTLQRQPAKTFFQLMICLFSYSSLTVFFSEWRLILWGKGGCVVVALWKIFFRDYITFSLGDGILCWSIFVIDPI